MAGLDQTTWAPGMAWVGGKFVDDLLAGGRVYGNVEAPVTDALRFDQGRGVADQHDPHFSIIGRPATKKTTWLARAAMSWFRRPASSRNARPSGVCGTMPRPTSLLTRMVGFARRGRARHAKCR